MRGQEVGVHLKGECSYEIRKKKVCIGPFGNVLLLVVNYPRARFKFNNPLIDFSKLTVQYLT